MAAERSEQPHLEVLQTLENWQFWYAGIYQVLLLHKVV